MLGISLSLSAVAARSKGVGWTTARLGASRLAEWDADQAVQLSLSSGNVVTWTDGVLGLAPTQGTSANRPAYAATGWSDGSAVINFDGANDELISGNHTLPSGASACEIWAILRQDRVNNGATAFFYPFGYGTSSNNASRLLRLGATTVDNGQALVGTGAATTSVTGPSVDAAGGFYGEHLVRLVVDGTNIRVDRNGLIGAATACIPATGSTRVKIGAAMTSAGFWIGGIKYVGVTGLLTGVNETAMWRYMLRRYAGVAGVENLLWIAGDSYSVPQGGDGMVNRFRASGRKAVTSGVVGSSLAQAVTRAQAMPWMRDGVQIVWDGSCNSYGTLAEDMAKYAQIAAMCPRTIIIPPVRRPSDDAGQLAAASALQAAIASAYPGRTLDMQSILAAGATSPGDDADVAANVVPRSLLIAVGSDEHLNTAGWNVAYPAISSLISSLGY